MSLQRRLAAGLAVGILALSLGGCLARRDPQSTGSLAASPAAAAPSPRQIEALAEKYDRARGDKASSLAYGHALRAGGQHAQALAVLEKAAIASPKDVEVLGAYGRSLIDAGRYQQAEDVLSRAHTPDRPDWRILSAQGTAADQAGEHLRAQGYYQTALKIAPSEPSVLSNLGLSYALSRKLPQAEAALRQAAALPGADERVRQNLAIVLGLQGKYSEAETLSRRDLAADAASSNLDYLKSLTTQNNRWQTMRGLDKAPPAKTRPTAG